MSNLQTSVVSDSSQPASKGELETSLDLISIAGQAALYSGVQQPVAGVLQLLGVKAPEMVKAPEQYEFNTREWYASNIGHGAGFMVPYLATSKLTGVAMKTGGAPKAMLDGALTGLVFTPVAEGENAFFVRGTSALNGGIMFGTQLWMTGKAQGMLRQAAQQKPLLAQTLSMHGMPTTTRLTINAGTGTAAGLFGLQASSIASGQGIVTDRQALLENAVASASTGFFLDAANIGLAKLRPRATKLGAPEQDVPAPRAVAAENVHADMADRSIRLDPKPERYELASEWTGSGWTGSKQYRTESGREFWQTPDGRIFYVDADGKTDRIWAPYGTDMPTAYVDGAEGRYGRKIYIRDEAQGFYLDREGRIDKPQLKNLYTSDVRPESSPRLTPALIERMGIRPRPFEADADAAARIRPMEDGAPFEKIEMRVRRPIGGKTPADISFDQYLKNHTQLETAPARRYFIRQSDGTNLTDQVTSIDIPEDYAIKLDWVRERRRTAIRDPLSGPEAADAILLARRELFLSPYGDRLLPEHWGQFLDVLPRPKLVDRLQLVDRIAEAPRHNGIADTAASLGLIRFHGEHNSVRQHVRQTLLHEWSHLVQESQPTLRKAFELASELETWSARQYARKSMHESWAVHLGEMLMDPNPELLLTFAHQSPIRTVILAETLQRELWASKDHTSLDHREFQARIRYINNRVMPIARDQMMTYLSSSDPANVAAGERLLDYLRSTGRKNDDWLATKLSSSDVKR